MQIWHSEIKDIAKLCESFKGLPDLKKELDQLIRTEDPNVVLLYSRRCLEVIITDLCERELKRLRRTEPLKGIIDKLNREEKVPPHIITSMDSLNSLSTFGTHPKEYDREQVRPVLIFLATILKWYLKYKNSRLAGLPADEHEDVTLSSAPEIAGFYDQEYIFEYKGRIEPGTINTVLKGLTQSSGFEILDKITGKRVYAIVVECVENISRYSVKSADDKSLPEPYLSVKKLGKELIITAGNPVPCSSGKQLSERLEQIKKSDKESLKTLFEEKLNSKLIAGEKSAGLGFIMMALKPGSRIEYSFNDVDQNYTVFEIQVSFADSFVRKLLIEKTESSPEVRFDFDSNIFEISGESRPNDVAGFYSVLLEWLDDFNSYLAGRKSIAGPIDFNFRIDYFNSTSARYILDFCKKLAGMRACGLNVSVKWHYKEDDEDMLEAGRELSGIARFPFSFILTKTQDL